MIKITHSKTFYGTLAEKIIADTFGMKRAPRNNRGYDLIDDAGETIDVKNSCLEDPRYPTARSGWVFPIKHNKIPKYFMLMALDSQTRLNPVHLWKIPGCVINHRGTLYIGKLRTSKWKIAEMPISHIREAYDQWKNDNRYQEDEYYYAAM